MKSSNKMESNCSDVGVPVISSTQDFDDVAGAEIAGTRESQGVATDPSSSSSSHPALSSVNNNSDSRIRPSYTAPISQQSCSNVQEGLHDTKSTIKIEPKFKDDEDAVPVFAQSSSCIAAVKQDSKNPAIKKEKGEIARWWKTDEEEKPIKTEERVDGPSDEDMMPPPSAPPPSAIFSNNRIKKIPKEPKQSAPREEFTCVRFLHDYANMLERSHYPEHSSLMSKPQVRHDAWQICHSVPRDGHYQVYNKKNSLLPREEKEVPDYRNIAIANNVDSASSQPGTSSAAFTNTSTSEDSVEKFYQLQGPSCGRKSSQPRRRDEHVVSSSMSDLGKIEFK